MRVGQRSYGGLPERIFKVHITRLTLRNKLFVLFNVTLSVRDKATMLPEGAKKPVGVDLFCGAGGMSLGFEQAGIDVVAAVDSEPIHVQTHLANFPDCRTLCVDLSVLSGNDLRLKTGLGEKHIDVLFGGPRVRGSRRVVNDNLTIRVTCCCSNSLG